LVALPALNEEATVGRVVLGVPASIPGAATVETLVVDDGSTDTTAARAAGAGAMLVRHPERRGVGSAFHSALDFMIAGGFDILVTIDADGQFDPKDIPLLAAPVVSGQADFATASRFKDPSLTPEMPFLKLWGNRLMSVLISRLGGLRLWDVSCGMRCYNRTAALHLHLLGRFTYSQEVILNLAFKGLRLVEVPLRVRGVREVGESRVARSLGTYAWQTIKIILRAYRDYRPMRFFGALSGVLLIPAVGCGVWLAVHYLRTGQLSPHKWAGFSSIALLALAVAFFLAGLIGDMLNRQRIYLEEILFRQRGQVAPASLQGLSTARHERTTDDADPDQQQHLPDPPG
jgi:glycosyltransferase involved in cell wall biosynthesis